MRYPPRRRPRRLPPPAPLSPLGRAIYAAGRRGDELLRQALPRLARNERHYNRLVGGLVIGTVALLFALAWLLGDWVQARFPPPVHLLP